MGAAEATLPHEGPARRPAPLSEQIADALRNGKTEGLRFDSPYANALLPLLQELGWHNYARELVEALPHFSDDIDLVDLRNILASLGYASSPFETRVDDIKAELYPCLFVGDEGEVLVLAERTEEGIRYYDADRAAGGDRDTRALHGTAYAFTDTHPTHGFSDPAGSNEPWFTQLLQRFRGLITHLLGMTFLINLVALLTPLFVMVVYDKVIGARSPDTLPYLVSGVIILMLADLLMRYLRARLLGSVAGRLDYLIGVETFRQLLYLPPLYTERSTVAAQLSRLRQFDSVRDFFTGPNAAIALELPFAVLFIGVIALVAGWIALIPLAMVVIYVLLGLLWFPHLDSHTQRSGRARADKQRMLMQTLAGRREIKAIGGESVWWERFREVSGEAVMASHRTHSINNLMHHVAQGLMTLSGIGVIGFGTLSVIEGGMSVGALIATMALVWRVLSPLQSGFLAFPRLQQTLKATRQINQMMRLSRERDQGHSGLILDRLSGRLRADRVSFRYAPDQDPALLGVGFEASPGEIVAIAGNTGSGKSTLLKLIAGMYQPQAGSLTMDGMDIRQINAMDLRRAIAYVPQETHLFHGTIAQNMRLNNALATDRQLRAAAAEAGILEEILALPEGFDTRIGDSATEHLPPGFLRALAMARAFVSPARILLLDEPGASLDEQADRRFMQQLKRLRGRRTVIMVSHRPSHIRLADRALLLEQGVLEFVGPPDQVVSRMLELAK